MSIWNQLYASKPRRQRNGITAARYWLLQLIGIKLHRRICFSITMSLYLHPALMCPNAVGQPRAGKVVVLVLTGHLDLAPSTQLQFDSMWKQA